MRVVALFAVMLLLAAGVKAPVEGVGPCQVHVILFLPSGVPAPAGYQQRVNEIVAYAEAFFRREMKRWGHERVVMPFRRSADGRVEATVMRGKQTTPQYRPVTLRAEVMDALRRQDRLAGGRQVWWIMVYAGDPPAKFAGFLGGFGARIGGWAVCNFDTTPGRIDPAVPLGSDYLERIALKGMLHELGHAFQLPHAGPLKRDNAGNTLMGPTHFNYRRVIPRPEQRVYLSEAEAAILSRHPAFRGVPDERGPMSRVEVQGMQYSADPRAQQMVVNGRVVGSERPVYALVADESDTRPGEYWTKTYVGAAAADGAFRVIVSEPSPAGGTLKTWFVFESGAQAGTGTLPGREGGIARTYTHNGQQWTFR